MDDLTGTTAVVTGAGSGLGRGLCRVLAAEGARVVAADVEAGALAETVADLEAGGATALGQVTDVSDPGAVDALAERAYERFGSVDSLWNNAGVFAGGWLWDTTDADWDWVLGVNVRGILHGIRSFVPRMLAQGVAGHVVNTASLAGLVPAPLSGPYCTSKFAAVGLSECLHHDLAMQAEARIGVSVVVPGPVATRIDTSSRNRPAALADHAVTDGERLVTDALAQSTAGGLDPDVAARRVLQEVRAGRFYITTSDAFDPLVANHNASRLARRAPELQTYG